MNNYLFLIKVDFLKIVLNVIDLCIFNMLLNNYILFNFVGNNKISLNLLYKICHKIRILNYTIESKLHCSI